jgi:hypothetical protein
LHRNKLPDRADFVAEVCDRPSSGRREFDLSIHRELEAIKEQLKNVAGFGNEIDHALERISAIEKHLGISKKIAA